MENYTYSEDKIIYINAAKILPNPYQPRKEYSRKSLKELSDSIKQYGVLQPILVRFINNKIYELISGERRLKAAMMAGLETIPAIVVCAGDREAAAIALAENIQRQDLNYIEEAEGMRILKYGFKYSTYEISHIINKSCEYIEDNLSILTFDNEIKRLLISNNISRNQARSLLKIDDTALQKKIIDEISKYNLNDMAAEDIVEGAIRQKKINNTIELNHMKLHSRLKNMRFLTNTLKQAVAVMKSEGMDTSYEISKNNDEYEVKILIKP